MQPNGCTERLLHWVMLDKDIHHMIALTCRILKKKKKKKTWYKSAYLQNGNRHTDLKNEFTVTRDEKWGGGIVREFGIDMYTLLYLKWIFNKDLRYSTGNSAQYYNIMQQHKWEKNFKEIDTCLTESLFCTSKLIHIQKNYCVSKH